jgi:hypothetical protein
MLKVLSLLLCLLTCTACRIDRVVATPGAHGRVVDALTMMPVKTGTVARMGNLPRTVKLDAQGNFRIRNRLGLRLQPIIPPAAIGPFVRRADFTITVPGYEPYRFEAHAVGGNQQPPEVGTIALEPLPNHTTNQLVRRQAITSLPSIDDAHWLDQKHWPLTLTNAQLTYQFDISILESSTNSISTTDFAMARASGKRYTARYVLQPRQELNAPQYTPSDANQIFYGPSFEWLPDGRLCSKAFHHGNGFKERHWLDSRGQPVWSEYDDHKANRYWMFRYDTEGKIAMRGTARMSSHGKPDDKEKFIAGDLIISSESKFLELARQYRREDIVGNRKQ